MTPECDTARQRAQQLMAGKASRAEVVAAIKALGSPPGVEKPTFLEGLDALTDPWK